MTVPSPAHQVLALVPVSGDKKIPNTARFTAHYLVPLPSSDASLLDTDLEVQLLVGGVQLTEEVEGLIHHKVRAGTWAVDLVHHHDSPNTHSQSLPVSPPARKHTGNRKQRSATTVASAAHYPTALSDFKGLYVSSPLPS